MGNYYKKKPYICDECGKDFAKPRQLKNHKKDVHAKKDVYGNVAPFLESQTHRSTNAE